jgi:hypothetical protein
VTIKFYKSVGGYDTCIKWRGRWHYAGHLFTLKPLIDKGYTLERVGTPKALEQAWAKHGATLAALKKELPSITLDEIPRRKA